MLGRLRLDRGLAHEPGERDGDGALHLLRGRAEGVEQLVHDLHDLRVVGGDVLGEGAHVEHRALAHAVVLLAGRLARGRVRVRVRVRVRASSVRGRLS